MYQKTIYILESRNSVLQDDGTYKTQIMNGHVHSGAYGSVIELKRAGCGINVTESLKTLEDTGLLVVNCGTMTHSIGRFTLDTKGEKQ